MNRADKRSFGCIDRIFSDSTIPVDIIDQRFGFLPAETGVGDRLSVDVAVRIYRLRAVLDVALDHETFYELLDVRVVAAAMQYLLGDADLL